MASEQKKPAVWLKKISTYENEAVAQAVAELGQALCGGWEQIVPRGGTVLLKPNFLLASDVEKAVITNPAIIGAVARACLDAGAGRVLIGDSPAIGSSSKAAAKAGLRELADKIGAEVIDFTETVTISAPEGFLHRQFTVAKAVMDADCVINLPKFKTHAMMAMTLAVKNLYGVFVGKQKARWHMQCSSDYNHFARLLVELAYTIRPAISIVDGIIGMEGNGPSNGKPRATGFLAAGTDMTALDRVCVEISGINPDTVYTLKVARDMGLYAELAGIDLIGDPLESARISDFAPASKMHVEGPLIIRPFTWLLRRWATTRPFIDPQRCRGCGLCVTSCPAETIVQPKPKMPVTIRHAGCIRCFCCQEVCPEGAITAQDAFGVRLMKYFGLE